MLESQSVFVVLLPSLRISGGVAETIKLASAVQQQGIPVQIIAFWKHEYELDTKNIPVEYLCPYPPNRASAMRQLPSMTKRWLELRRAWKREKICTTLLLTHFTTFFFAILAPKTRRVCFNQDLEWNFTSRKYVRAFLKKVILFVSRRSAVITTNRYITRQFESHGVKVFGEAAIWADSKWIGETLSKTRDNDVVVLLRNTPLKRLDLYIELLSLLKADGGITVTAITPDSNIPSMVENIADTVLLRPTNEEMKTVFSRSRVFVLLSDIEGLGLPPLESMGSGCVPICRECGGVENYMHGKLASMTVSLESPMSDVRDKVIGFLRNPHISAEDAREQFIVGMQEATFIYQKTLKKLGEFLLTR